MESKILFGRFRCYCLVEVPKRSGSCPAGQDPHSNTQSELSVLHWQAIVSHYFAEVRLSQNRKRVAHEFERFANAGRHFLSIVKKGLVEVPKKFRTRLADFGAKKDSQKWIWYWLSSVCSQESF